MNPKPTISFLLPYRWLTDDKKYLGENLRRQIIMFLGDQDALQQVLMYRVHVSYTYREPIQIPLTKTQLQLALKPLMPVAKCLDITQEYKYKKSKTMLPLVEFQFYV